MNKLALPLLLIASTATAQPIASPGEETGRIDRTDDPDSTGRLIARGILFVPKVAVRIALSPFEGAAWATDRYQIPQRLDRLFWNDAGTIGLLPTFQLDAGFGVNAGAHFIDRDLFGARERLDLKASGGGRFRQRYVAALRSGRRLGNAVALESQFEYERRPKDPFHGIGNDDTLAMAPAELILPTAGSLDTRFRHDLMRGLAVIDVGSGELHARASGSIADHTFAGSEVGSATDERYMGITGFDGHRTAYSELELRWDTRRAVIVTEAAATPSTGGLIAGFAGHAHALDDGADFWRYGADLQRFFRLADGPRVLGMRAHAEGVTGALDEVPFDELPRLGGATLLRGYSADRFRDRLAVCASLDYRWDLSRDYSATLFTDAGRVYRSPRDVDLHDLRVGYGVSLETHTGRSFLARLSLATSIDGGVFFDLSFDPVFEVDGRVQRR